jgi:hypothetical protein
MVHLRIIDIQRAFTAADVIRGCTANMEALVIALFEWKYVYQCRPQGEVDVFALICPVGFLNAL